MFARLFLFGLAFTLLVLTLPIVAQDAAQDVAQGEFQTTIQPLLKNYCYDCHGNDNTEGDLNLEAFGTPLSILEGRRKWIKVVTMVQASKMPPDDADKPTDPQREHLAKWVDNLVNNIDCQLVDNPGRPTIRRLNRNEYRNTIRDLVGVDYQPAENFPADDVGYGFDNIGDVLSLPPLLMEKYLTAAEAISSKAIVTEFDGPIDLFFNAANLKSTSGSGGARGTDRTLASTGEMFTTIKVKVGGEYELRAEAFGDQAGPEKVKMKFLVDNKEVRIVTVPATRSKPATYSHKTRLTPGNHKISLAFINDYYMPKAKNPADRDRNLIVRSLEIKGPANYEPPNLPASHKAIVFAKPTEKVSREEASRTILKRLASRAFRRVATDREVERLIELTKLVEKSGGNYYEGIQIALQAILVSPHFLFKVEQPPGYAKVGKDYPLDDFQLAANLSYFLWNSMPDNELFGHAWNGTLRQGDNLRQQVGRMLVNPRSRTLITDFAEQWLQLRNLETMEPDRSRFPSVDAKMRESMRMETLMLFNYILRQNRSVLELLTADYTFVDDRLAKHYGIQGVLGDKFRLVSLDGYDRSGLLSHASVLMITSNPTRTSPVKRGKWILENLLNQPPPPPAPDVMELEDQKQLRGTLRQRMEQHRRDPRCASCHQEMDPLGFALENFDAVGRWRTQDGEGKIDASGELPTGEKFRGPAELQAVLLKTKKREFVRCLIEKMLTYALGRGLEYYDQCAVDEIYAAVEKDNFRFATLILEIVKSEPFQKRKVKS